jgi:hypothetical protein
MKHYYPVGGQYCKLTGKGSLAGIADDILNISKNHRERKERESIARAMRTVEMRDYKRESRAKPIKRMTMAMLDIIKYIKKWPGTSRSDLLNKPLGGDTISPSSLGASLAALVQRGMLETNGFTKNRRFFVTGVTDDKK